jgi:hypothetical protein
MAKSDAPEELFADDLSLPGIFTKCDHAKIIAASI